MTKTDRQKPNAAFILLKQRIHVLLGFRDPRLSFEDKVFCIVVFSITFATTAGLVSNIILGISGGLNVLLISGMSTSAGTFYLIRYKNKAQQVKFPYLGIMLILMCAAWFLNSGLNGPILYLFFCMMVLAMVLIETRYHIFYMLILVSAIVLLVSMEIIFPQWLVAYASEAVRHGDLLYTSIICMVTVGALVSILKKSYERDRKELKVSQLHLVQARKDAEAATNAKSKFLSNMSHEIRTPLNGIIGTTELLKQTPLSEEQKKLIDVLQSGSDLLLNIMNDVLDISKVEADKLKLQPKPCSIGSMIRDVIAITSSTLKPSIKLDYTIDENVHDGVIADESRVKQVLLNLVGNAVKFTDSGNVQVIVTAEPANKGVQQVIFKVVDSGIGISEADLAKLFKPFSQIDNIATRKYGGTGLGLSICKKLVEMMGGTVSAQSTEGLGSVFSFMLPLQSAETGQHTGAQETMPEGEPGDFGKLKILLAEDNAMNRFVIERMFRVLGCRIEMVDNGRQALERACSEAFDLVFMDIQMPLMDGLQATREIIAWHEANQQTAPFIIALTADAMKEDEQRCLEAGMNDYLSKPLAIKELRSCLHKWSNQRQFSS